MKDNRIVQATAALEIMTGLALLAVPDFLIGLLIGDGIGAIGTWVARMLAVALLSFGIASWEPTDATVRISQRIGLFAYNVGASATLIVAGIRIDDPGILLWPTAVLHGVLGLLLIRSVRKFNVAS
jgi:hypothetical protein